MFAADLKPSWLSRLKTNVTLLFYFLKLYDFVFQFWAMEHYVSEAKNCHFSVFFPPEKLVKIIFFLMPAKIFNQRKTESETKHLLRNLGLVILYDS